MITLADWEAEAEAARERLRAVEQRQIRRLAISRQPWGRSQHVVESHVSDIKSDQAQ